MGLFSILSYKAAEGGLLENVNDSILLNNIKVYTKGSNIDLTIEPNSR